jgi:hypothetical protein
MKFDVLADNFQSPRLMLFDCDLASHSLKVNLIYVSMGLAKLEMVVKNKEENYQIKLKLHPQMMRLKMDIADLLIEYLEVLEHGQTL